MVADAPPAIQGRWREIFSLPINIVIPIVLSVPHCALFLLISLSHPGTTGSHRRGKKEKSRVLALNEREERGKPIVLLTEIKEGEERGQATV
jgi:hypothetical protein